MPHLEPSCVALFCFRGLVHVMLPFRAQSAPTPLDLPALVSLGADNGGRSVFRRLDSWAANREERRQRRELAKESEQARLYRPRVSDATDIILTARPARLHETESERVRSRGPKVLASLLGCVH